MKIWQWAKDHQPDSQPPLQKKKEKTKTTTLQAEKLREEKLVAEIISKKQKTAEQYAYEYW